MERLEDRMVLDAYGLEVLADNPLVYYPLNEGTGSTAVDASGNGFDGQIVNAIYSVQSRGGTALSFDGVGDLLRVVNNGLGLNNDALDSLAANNTATVEFWVYDQSRTNNFGFSNGGGATTFFSAHVPWSDSNVYFDTGGCCGATQRLFVGVGNTTQARWSHWAFVKDGNVKTIYRNGIAIATSATQTSPIGNSSVMDTFQFGASSVGANGIDAVMDDLAVYDTALSAARILEHYRSASVIEPDSYAVTQDGVLTVSDSGGTTASVTDDGVLANDPFRGVNVARLGTASQTSTRSAGGAAQRALDGNVDGVFAAATSVSHTNGGFDWWQVNLGADRPIEKIVLTGRTDCCLDRLDNYRVSIWDGDPNGGGTELFSQTIVNTQLPVNNPLEIILPSPVVGDFVRVQLTESNILSLAEVQVFASGLEVASVQGVALGGSPAVAATSGGGQVTMNPDGTFTYDQLNAFDSLPAGATAVDTFTYQQAPRMTNFATNLGAGTAALLGRDLTDPENDGVQETGVGFNATFDSSSQQGWTAQSAFSVFDNVVDNGNGKWCCNGGTQWVSATFAQAYYLTHFTIASSGDSPARDPDVWSIQGSNDGTNWTPIYSYSNDGISSWAQADTPAMTDSTRNKVLLYSSPDGPMNLTGNVANFATPTTAYTSFRYLVTSTGGGEHALNELELFGVTSIAPPTASITITGINDPPAPDAGGPYVIAEGQSLSLAANHNDPDVGDTHTYTWDINGDGTYGDATGQNPTLSWAQLQSLLPAIDDGPAAFNVSVQVTDNLLLSATSAPVSLTLNNAPPAATISGPTSTVPGFEVTFNLGAVDPSSADQAGAFSYMIDWKDGTPLTQTVNGTAAESVAHTFSLFGTYVVEVTATDKDGGVSAVATHTIEVVPVAMIGDDVYAGGTPASDTIIFSPSLNGVRVRYNNVNYPTDGSAFVLNANSRLVAFGEEGSDRIIVSGSIGAPAVFEGGGGNDYLAGGVLDDIIIGGAGNDVILAGEGNNLLIGDDRDGVVIAGSDRLDSRAGADTLFGGGANDRLHAGAGDDIVDGGAGNDFLFGDLGNDLLSGGSGTDTINGSWGNDVILGGDDPDQLFGASDQDLLFGGLGSDRLRGDAGDDDVIGGTSALEADIQASLNAMLASMARTTLAASGVNGAAVDAAVTLWFTTGSDRSGFGTLDDSDGSDDLTGGSGIDEFHSALDNIRDFRMSEDSMI